MIEFVKHLIQFGSNHWIEILAILGGLDLILGVITKWTKVEWDDNLYSAFHNWITKLGKK